MTKALGKDARAAVNRVRDEYAAVETYLPIVIQMVGRLCHMRDGAARMVNYDVPEITSASFDESDAHTASALEHLALALSEIKKAHTEDAGVLGCEGIKVGRPRTRRIREVAERILDEIEGKEKFGR